MKKLTIHILIKNNEDTIIKCLDSIQPLNAKVLVVNTGCMDKTVEICCKYGAEVIKNISLDRSVTRNAMTDKSQTNWQLYIEPWEILLNGHDRITSLNNNNYYCDVLHGDIITKEVRIWRKNSNKKFVNPVFESIKDDTAVYAEEIMFFKEKSPEKYVNEIEMWKKSNPLAIEPYYYQAYSCLGQKQYKEFLSLANHCLFYKKDKSISTIMMQYYVGIVHCYITNDLEIATKNAVVCLGEHVLMAEFWCLLGDIFFQGKEYGKAKIFYENAKTLGSYRLRSDRWPIHISKYDEYPTEIIGKLNI